MTDFFQKLTSHCEKQLPFVVYRKPNHNQLRALLQPTMKEFFVKDFTEEGFVFAPFDSDRDAFLLPRKNSEMLEMVFELTEKEENIQNAPKGSAFSGFSEHIELIKKGIAAIKSGSMEKVVLSRKQEVELDEENVLTIFRRLLTEYPTAFVYCWFHPGTGFWLGATPETLVQIHNNRLKTMALAGTQAYRGTLDAKWGKKEQEEQQFVTDSIISSLDGKVTDLNVSATETVKAGKLLHLQTKISGKMEESNLKEMVHDLHPTPAVCGLPKAAAKEFIFQNEPYDREFYTGFLGELNLKVEKERARSGRNQENKAYRVIKRETNLFVNLRCMKIEAQKATLFIGGGITADSDPKSEWKETENKAETMLRGL